MALSVYKASAPGSLMLLGEHAVLRHHEAIVCAIEKRIAITMQPRNDQRIMLKTQEFGEFTTTLTDLKIQAPYNFVLAAMLYFKPQLVTGVTIDIDSEFSAQLGFGSSAAITIAMVAVLSQWLKLSLAEDVIFNHAKQIMLNVQGIGSGADLAASLYGGVLHYTMTPWAVARLPLITALTAIYSGAKLPTKEVLAKVAQQNAQHTEIYQHIFQGIATVVQQGVIACRQQNWPMLGKLFSIQQGLLQALGVSTALLDTLVWQLQTSGALGAKISGSGLGDCVIGLGPLADLNALQNNLPANIGVKLMPLQLAAQGLQYA